MAAKTCNPRRLSWRSNEHRAVAECAVFGVPDPRWGERVHAIVIPRAGVELDEDALIEHLRVRMAGYKVPRSVEIRLETMWKMRDREEPQARAACPLLGPPGARGALRGEPDNER